MFIVSSRIAYTEQLKSASSEAFELAAQAASDLDGDVKPPVAAIAGWLFGDPPAWDEAKKRLGNVKNIPATFSTDKKDMSNPNDIIVYCNMERYKQTDREDSALYDPDTDTYELLSNDDFIMCKEGKSINGQQRPKAVTNNFYSLDLRKPPPLTTIDLCNWEVHPDFILSNASLTKHRYLEQVKKDEWAKGSDVESPDREPTLGSLWGLFKDISKEILEGFSRTQMDTAALFEHTLLHEMTHSKAVGLTQAKLGEKESYGWDECLEVKSATNSESLAYFAIGCRLIGEGLTIDFNGDIKSPSPSLEDSDDSSQKMRRAGMTWMNWVA
ncbi:MAG: hypothetical protein Q9164_002379 [Protoblastenia rupestris]